MSTTIIGSERLLVVVGPSGAGKDSVIGAWLAALPEAERPYRARRTITRPVDVHEDHEPLTLGGFREALGAGAFAFDWEAHGLFYGVRREELLPLAAGRWVVMNGSREHLPRLRAQAPLAHVLAIDAPPALRAARLGQRGRETGAECRARLARGGPPTAPDRTIVNDRCIEDAAAELEAWWRRLSASQLATSTLR